jgi:aminopeptidase N
VLKTARACLNWYIENFGSNFPFSKLDIVFTPNFKVTKAIQNVGCILIDEGLIFNTPNKLEACDLNKIIANNICHMWFGNAITSSWWNDTWLNDAFSLFLSQHCLKLISETVNKSINNF